MKNIYLQILNHLTDYSHLIIATVTRSQGSTPQKPGSSALFSKQGMISGTVGGGIVEGKVQKIVIDAFLSGESGHFHFNLDNDISRTEDAICGGQISILVDANPDKSIPVFKQIKQSMEKRIPGVLLTVLNAGKERSLLISRYWVSGNNKPPVPEHFIETIEQHVEILLSDPEQSDYRELKFSIPGEESSYQFFLEPIFPPEQLVIAGAGHIGRSLACIGNMLDFEVIVIDDRAEYANSENIPSADRIVVKDIGQTMRDLEKTDTTYVVIVTRGHKDDAEALKPCIGSGIAYIGMIGSKNKTATMRASFIERGWATAEQWDEIYAPVGLDIKSQTVEEIAVSIAAQLILVRNGRKMGVGSRKSEVGSRKSEVGSKK